MKIKDLKEPYKSMALYEQKNQGNEENETFELIGIFDWDKSLCESDFWDKTDDGDYPEITPEIKEKFPPEIFKTKLEVGKKYRLEWWDSDEWAEVLYIGKYRFFSIDEFGKEDSWIIDGFDWLSYEEEQDKGFKDYEKFYLLDCDILTVVYAKNINDILANYLSVDKVYTEEQVIEKGLKI